MEKDPKDKESDKIIQRLPKEPLHKVTYKSLSTLDLNDPSKFKLLDIEKLDTKEYRQVYQNITLLNVSNNSISTLKLKNYNLLQTIKAIDNSLTRVELNLPRLTEIDLTDNMLTGIFELSTVPLLAHLYLNKNAIKTITYENLRSVKNTLVTLEIEKNRLDFPSVKEFFELFESLGRNMKKLKTLNIMENSFNQGHNKVYKEYFDFILTQLPNLEILNCKSVFKDQKHDETTKSSEFIKNKMFENERLEGPVRAVGDSGGEKKSTSTEISLSFLNKQLEKYSLMGKLNKATFKEFKLMADEYFKGNEKSKSGSGENDIKMEDSELNQFEALLEYCNILTDSTPAVQRLILELIANFCIIKNGKFSYLALSYILQRLTPENIRDIDEIITQVIIEDLWKKPEDELSPVIITGLEPFLKEDKMVNSFMQLQNKMIQAIKKFSYINLLFAKSSKENQLKDLYYCMISFISSSCKNNHYLNIFISNKDIIESISSKIKSLLKEPEENLLIDFKVMEILQNLLNIVKSICVFYIEENPITKANIKLLVDGGLKDSIEQSLGNKFAVMARAKGGDKKEQNVSKQIILKKQQIMANLIRCYGALLSKSESVKQYIDNKTSTANKIMSLLTQNENFDPILISAACDFSLYFFNNKKMLGNEENIFSSVTSKLYALRFLTPFLNTNSIEYKGACEVAEKYGDITMIRGVTIAVTVMNSEIINNFIISIINLIEFLGRYSKKESKIKSICADISQNIIDQKLNGLLINWLSAQSNEVKFAIVVCLFSNDCKKLSFEEINAIWKQLTKVNLMGAIIIKTVTIIFLILTKFFVNCLINNKNDVVDQNKEAFIIAFDILLKNEERNVSDESDIEMKSYLSISILTLLYNCSCFESISQIYSDSKNTSKAWKILYYEEKNNTHNANKKFTVPIEIEKTRTGCKLENLMNCLKDEGMSLRPYTYVSLRLIIHFADVLMNVPNLIYEMNDKDDYDTILNYLKNEIIKRECDRINSESKTFSKIINDKLKNPKIDGKSSIYLRSSELKEEQLRFLKMFPLITKYISGALVQRTISEFKEIFEDKFDKKYEKIYFSTDAEISNTQDGYDQDGELPENLHIYNTLISYLREEDYYKSSSENISKNIYEYITKDKLKFLRYGSEGITTRMVDEEHPDNPFIRSLFVAAYLRSILAILEFGVDKNIFNEMIKLIYSDTTIEDISKLTDCTKLLDCNISNKYIVIMTKVLIQSDIFFQINGNSKAAQNKFLKKVGVISYTLKKMVKIYSAQLDLKDEDQCYFLQGLTNICVIIDSLLEGIEFVSEELRDFTCESIVSFEIISLLIEVVKDYMKIFDASFNPSNSEKEKKKESGSILDDMITSLPLIIGQYMSKNKKHSYSILENFNRSIIFDKIKLRKTYIKEILETVKLNNLKRSIFIDKKIKIMYLNRAFLTKYTFSSYHVIILFLQNGFRFLYGVDPNDASLDLKMTKFNIIEDMNINFSDVESVICFDLPNRLLIKSTIGIYSLMFYKNNIRDVFMTTLRTNCPNLSIYENVPIFGSEDMIEKQKALLEKKKHTDTPEEEQTEEANDDEEPKPETVIIYCKNIHKRFFDFILNAFKKNELIKDAKVFVIQDDKLKIYEEVQGEWDNINLKNLFKTSMQLDPGTDVYLGNFSHCFKLIDEIPLTSNVKEFTLLNVDEIIIQFEDGRELKFEILDDFSYVKVKKALIKYMQENALQKDEKAEDF